MVCVSPVLSAIGRQMLSIESCGTVLGETAIVGAALHIGAIITTGLVI